MAKDYMTLGEGQGLCPLCGVAVPISATTQIERDMDTDAKSCGVCCRTFGEARRECDEEANEEERLSR